MFLGKCRSKSKSPDCANRFNGCLLPGAKKLSALRVKARLSEFSREVWEPKQVVVLPSCKPNKDLEWKSYKTMKRGKKEL